MRLNLFVIAQTTRIVGSGDNSGGVINNIVRHREELHLIAVVIPTWVYAILWRSSFVYTSALIRKSRNSAPHDAHDYQSHFARHTRLSITLCTALLTAEDPHVGA